MPQSRLPGRAGFVLVLSALLSSGHSDEPIEPTRRAFFKDSRAELALARARGDSTVSVAIAAQPRKVRVVVRAIGRLGGSVRYHADDVDYVRARMPTDSAERIFDIPEVQTADIDVSGAWTRPLLQTDGALDQDQTAVDTLRRWPPALVDAPISQPYSPLEDLDARAFRDQHPSYDGRGITVAILDGHPDLLLPELRYARTLDGARTRKVVRYLDVSDPAEPDDITPHWVRMDSLVVASDSLGQAEARYRTPRSGRFRFGLLDERRFSGNGLDLNRDGNPAGASRVFGVLWDPASGEVWVDADQDLDFRNERPLRDYGVAGELGLFGQDDPGTAVRESVAFGVQIERDRGYVVINPGLYGHGTIVSGAIAANRADGGRVDGVAPEARLAAIKYAHRTSGLIEGLIYAYRDPQIDLVILQQNVVIAIPYLLQDGRFTASVIADRLVARYGKPLFVPASNVPGLNTTSEHGVSEAAISVGAYQSADNYSINSGITTAARDNLHSIGSFGPGGNGAMQPDLLAPAAVPTVNPGIEAALHRPGLYTLRPGYALCGGTSCATPVAAGAAALLMSAARQTGLTITANQLRTTLFATTRVLPEIPAYQQGRGLIQVQAAWTALQQLATGATPAAVTGRAPVRTRLSSWLAEPGMGAGLYEREGWRAGQQERRTIVLTRTTGPGTPIEYRVRWSGDVATFSSADRVMLPLNHPTPLDVAVAPARPGAHSATLVLSRQGEPGQQQVLMAAVIAAHQLDSTTAYSAIEQLRIARPGRGSIFVNVPEGTRALRIGLEANGIVQLGLRRPDGRQELPTEPKTAGAQVRVIPDPMPGVWEAIVTAVHEVGTWSPDYPAPLTPVDVTLRASAHRVLLTSRTVARDAPGGRLDAAVTARNQGAAFHGAASTTALGSARRAERTIGAREQHRYDIDVPSGSVELQLMVDGRAGDDLDLYLFDCTRPEPTPCAAAGAATNPGSGDRLSYRLPTAGRWVAVVDAARIDGTDTRYRYLDVVVNPRFGSVAVADGDTARAIGSSWTVPASVWLAGGPISGRAPVAILQVTGDSSLTHYRRTTSLELIGPKVNAVLGSIIVDLGPDPRQ